ncbi:MAG: histidine kinase [Bacteroidetes bacterium]|nr:histidine kinase [Bacteroidota bacterium]MBU1116215.1 histidine kinase [Bacteroidota bacterium]MBU1798587.1 histidine kinase [Bacteroidota bacterium]
MRNIISKNINYRNTLNVIIGVVGFFFFLLLHFIENIEFEIAFIDSLITSGIFILIAFSLWYPANYLNIENYSLTNLLVYNLLIAIITSIISIFFSYFVMIFLNPNYELFYISTLVLRFSIGTLCIVIIIISNYVVIFYNNLTEKVIGESKLNSLIAEAELKSLKYQINPHFIFNSLNSISSLTISNPEKAQEMSINLSEFLRKILAGNDVKKVSLEEELKNINLYLKIEKIRFGNRLEFALNLSEDCKNIQIPNMILQPLIENCVKHGVYESSDTIHIDFNCKRKENYLEITISNNFDSTFSNKRGEGIGLQNINSRLKLIYNKPNLISIKKLDNIFTVILLIPVE